MYGSMPTILFRSPDPEECITISLEPGTAVLLGRHPDPSRLQREGLPALTPGALSIVIWPFMSSTS